MPPTGYLAPMALNLKNPKVEALVEAIAAITGETKTGAVLRALEERHQRLALREPGSDRAARLRRFLQTEAWPMAARQALPPLTRDEHDALLGFGPEGV